jgi:hypothetical protein
MWYRVLKRLTTGQEVGDVVNDSEFVLADRLVMMGALGPAHLPPLGVVSSRPWGAGIETVEGALDADAGKLAEALGVAASDVRAWQAELVEAVTLRECKSGKCGRR